MSFHPDVLSPNFSEEIVALDLGPLADLADMAGKVQITVKAEKADGLDKAKLQNGVMEPLREANLIQ